MQKSARDAALQYHSQGKPGKIEVVPTKPHSTQNDLTLAYSPGVAEPCLEIEKDESKAYEYTAKGNLVAVISNGTAVLGLGDIGALAGKPVMEGKGLLFKIFAGIDVFDIEVDEKDPEKFIQTVKAISPTFGGINLEDIKAPECFEIETRLKEALDIPVMHDDQHGTAIISSAALLNALEVAGKKIEDIHLVVNGAGASAVSCTKLYMMLGVRKENVLMVDSKGVLSTRRTDLNDQKKFFAAETDRVTLAEAIVGADVFLGLSKADVLTQEMVRSMAENPIVFALANPNPEISYEDAKASRPDLIFATGRSDYPNQVNNVLGFPYIFRGALDVQATTINEEMKLAAVRAIAELGKEPVPEIVNSAYGLQYLFFGREYLIPKPLDPRLLSRVSMAVARAAMDSGVAKKPILNWTIYENKLTEMMGYSNKFIRRMTNLAKTDPQRVVFSEANHINMVKAAIIAKKEGICQPILLANKQRLQALADEHNLDISGLEVIQLRQIEEDPRRDRFAKILAERKSRQGETYHEAFEKMNDRNYFGMMMVETGEADAMITGVYSHYQDFAQVAEEVIGISPKYKYFGAMHIFQTKKGVMIMGDTLINRNPCGDVLVDMARQADDLAKFFNMKSVTAVVSFSNFGADNDGAPRKVADAVKYLHENHPELVIDGEMQMNFALNKEMRDKMFPFSKLYGKDVNTILFPDLTSANIASKIMLESGISSESVGPIQTGLNKPVHFTDIESSVRDIVNLTTVAVIDAIVHKKIEGKERNI
ncbi:MAG: NADP-dependent malate dehydrogenase [Bacteroidetes bacterium]|nr:NADP-dependent malate dehydrogenase [Bacteroidota bacterium]